ncbi:MAG: hypothetical protein AB1413_10090 [Thermodesulfobacteriota bacterium]
MKQTNRHAKWTTAITFAEAGEWETARLYMPPVKTTLRAWLEKTFMAVAFAEEGLADEAVRLSGEPPRRKCGCCEAFLAQIGLSEAPMTFGLVPSTQFAGRR